MNKNTQAVYVKFLNFIDEASELYNVPIELIAAIIFVESSGNKLAQAETTSARGLMQLTRAAAKDMGVDYDDLFDARVNIIAGTRYLATKIKECNGDERRGIMSYYAGFGTISDGKETQLDHDAAKYADKVYACLA